ncbi:MAG: hypothetical protein KY476_05165 [Planctomycetes bacterium]|nr:hypothetical protein [Planctomycetota bacterium]
MFVRFAIFVVIVVLPFILGTLIARLLKLKDLSGRIGVVLFALFLGLAPFIAQNVIGYTEQAEYEDIHAAWEERGRERASNSKITEAGVEQLQQARPDVKVYQGIE